MVGPHRPGSAIRVDNAFGDVRLRHGGSEGNLEVAAILQQLSIDGSKLVLSVDVTDDAAVVTIVRYDHEGNPAPQAPRGDKARADLAIMVPEGFPIRVETDNGLIEARGVRTDIDLNTSGGTIRVAQHHGGINARSEGGTMEITLLPSVTYQDPGVLLDHGSDHGVHTVQQRPRCHPGHIRRLHHRFLADRGAPRHRGTEQDRDGHSRRGRRGADHGQQTRVTSSLRRFVTIDTDSSK